MTYRSRILCGAVKVYHSDYEARPTRKQSVNQLTGLSRQYIGKNGVHIVQNLLVPDALKIAYLARHLIIDLDKANKSLHTLITSKT